MDRAKVIPSRTKAGQLISYVFSERFQLDGKLTMDQLRCNGVLEGIRICRRGYPNRLPFAQFIARYRLLQHNIGQAEEEEEPREAVQRLCSALGLGPDRFQVGRTKLFCRVGLVSELEARRRHRLEQLLTGLQAQIRWWRAQLEVKRRREEWLAKQNIIQEKMIKYI
jgi:myosin heavy subunit